MNDNDNDNDEAHRNAIIRSICERTEIDFNNHNEKIIKGLTEERRIGNLLETHLFFEYDKTLADMEGVEIVDIFNNRYIAVKPDSEAMVVVKVSAKQIGAIDVRNYIREATINSLTLGLRYDI